MMKKSSEINIRHAKNEKKPKDKECIFCGSHKDIFGAEIDQAPGITVYMCHKCWDVLNNGE
jgi:hypothetical protein